MASAANEIPSPPRRVNYTGACPERSRRDGDALYASRMALRDGLRVEKSSGTLYRRTYTGQMIEARSLRPERLYGETNTTGGMQRNYIFFGAGVYPDLFVRARYYNPRLGRPDAFTDTGRSAWSEPGRSAAP